jgi:hypothetical protein
VKKYIELKIIFPALILLLPGFCTVCGATKLQEQGLQINTSMAEGKVSGAKATINAAHGGPKIHSLKVAYPAATILTATLSINNKKGYYRIELLENGKPTLNLAAKDGKAVQGSGRISVNKHGEVEYRVTALKAKGVAYEMAFGPVTANTSLPATKPVSAEKADAPIVKPKPAEKVAQTSDDIALTIVCLPGKKCLIRVQNKSKTKGYRNIQFVINYQVMTEQDYAQKAKVGTIEDTMYPLTVDEWPLSLIFGEPPKDIKIALVKAEMVDPAEFKKAAPDQKNTNATPLTTVAPSSVPAISPAPPAGKSKKDEPVTAPPSAAPTVPAVPATAVTPAAPPAPLPRIIVTNKQLSSLRFFESGADPIPAGMRSYKNEFAAANIRFINWELNLRNTAKGQKVVLDIEMMWKRLDGSVITKQKLDVIPKPEEENLSLTSSLGNATPGKEWQPGFYTVEFYSGAEKIAVGSFKVN